LDALLAPDHDADSTPAPSLMDKKCLIDFDTEKEETIAQILISIYNFFIPSK
jgi:hypothetical protein